MSSNTLSGGMKLSVIIVNYNVRRYLFQCLCSVKAAIVGLDADVWVVDNASQDGSIAFLRSHFPEIHFIENEDNVGFSRANNAAIRMTQSDYVLLLNPDTIVTHAAILECVRWMDEHPDAGSVGAALHNASGSFAWESRRGVPTPFVSFCKISGLNRLFPRHHVIGRYYMRYLDRNEASEIDILSGAYMMLRRKALDQVGLLDETFFMYGEDIDLSYRLLRGGWKNYYIPRPVLHYKGESEHPSTIRYVNVFHQAMIIFYEKHFSKKYFLSGFLIRMAVYFKAFLTLCKHGISKVFRLFPHREEHPHFYCYCGDANKEAVERLAHEQGATIEFAEFGQYPTENKNTVFMLFDTTTYSYDQILAHLVQGSEKGMTICLATYTPQIGILLP